MARQPRICLAGTPQHIIQRGNNRQACFASEEDFAAYANWLAGASSKHGVAIHAWVFMTNHVHMLATPTTNNGLSRMMQSIGRRYVRYFNHTYRRSGTLWEGRFKSCIIDAEDYLLICQLYIELNPVRAGMVEHPADYRWSSYTSNGLARPACLWTPHELWRRLGETNQDCAECYRQLFRGQINPATLTTIRESVNKGLALGNDRFRQQIEQLTGCRTTPRKRGPKPKQKEPLHDDQGEFLL